MLADDGPLAGREPVGIFLTDRALGEPLSGSMTEGAASVTRTEQRSPATTGSVPVFSVSSLPGVLTIPQEA
jgi:hypothetical protein